MVSVIIPVYNGAIHIAAAARSALDQTYADREVIVVNDGSTDGTLAELEKFGEAIRVISIRNGGVSNARNVGILASRGELIAFLDADDVWRPDNLAVQVAAMEANPDVGFSCCNYLVLDRAGGRMIQKFEQHKGDPAFQFDAPLPTSPVELLLARGNFVGTASNVVVRRDVLDRAGLFDTRFRQAEDLELFIRCALFTRFLLVSKILLRKTTHETNLTNDLVDTLQCHEQVLLTLLENPIIKSRAHLIPFAYQGLAAVRYQLGNQFFYRGDLANCSRYFLAGLKSERSVKNVYQFLRHSVRKLGQLVLETLRLRVRHR